MSAEHPQPLVVGDPGGIAWFPDGFLTPDIARAQGDDGTVPGLLLMQPAEGGADEPKPPRLDRILMRDDHHVAVGVLAVQPAGGCGHPLPQFVQRFVGEVEILRIFEIGLQLTGKGGG